MSIIELTQVMTNIIAVLGLIISGSSLFIAIRTHKMSLFSQKLQNAQALTNSFYNSLRKDDIHNFREIIMLRGESAGGDNYGHYMGEDGQLHDFSLYFAEGAPDGGSLERIVHNLNRVCLFANNKSIDLQFFYSELGHYIKVCYEICETINSADENLIHCYKELKEKYSHIYVVNVGHIE